MGFNDTIAAVSTPRGKGGIAVIRISGDDTREIASRVFRPCGKCTVNDAPVRRALYGTITSPGGDVLDTGILVIYEAPHSYTGEDMAELSCHGGVYVTGAVLSAVFEAGAVQAQPGEFTRRAFTNGKMSLTEAEAVGLLLDADTEEKMKLSSSAQRGSLKNELKRISDELYGVLSSLYAAIDYPDEDIQDSGESGLADAVISVERQIRDLLGTYKRGRAVADGVKCVICGRPNAGKSSLYNRISRSDDAIVTDVAGTTRDILRDTVSFGGITLRLSDTAGLRDASDKVEKIGVQRAVSEIESAELILAVFDSGAPLDEYDKKMIKSYPGVPRVAVINKTDLGRAMEKADIELISASHDKTVYLSCETGEGMDALETAVRELFDSEKLNLSSDAVIWDARQKASLEKALSLIGQVEKSLETGAYIDAVCTVCEEALGVLLETDGRGVTDEIVNNIFARFCVGK